MIDLGTFQKGPVTVIVKYRGDFGAMPSGLMIKAEDLGGGFAVVMLYAENIGAFLESPSVVYAEADKTLVYQQTEISGGSGEFYCGEDTGLDGEGVVVGVIDSRIDVEHPAFKNTEISCICEENISESSHGTNVAGIIAAAAPKAEIIGIGISGAGADVAKASEIMAAVERLVELSSGRPLVINISYGTNDGSHMGDSLFEEYLNGVAQNEATAIVAAAGNFGSLARHFYGVSDGSVISAEISVTSKNFRVGIWRNFADVFSVQLTAPNNETFTLSERTGNIYFHGNIGVFRDGPAPYSLNAGTYISFENAEGGIWRITLYPYSLATAGAVNMWLSANIFVQPFADTTITVPAYAERVITVAAYDPRSDSAAPFSGRGYSADGLIKPDIAAPGVDILTAENGGGYTTVSGTSFSAPFVGAACARLMQWGIVLGNDPFLYGQRLKAYLRRGARRLRGLSYPNREWGYGALCMDETLKLLEKEKMG